MKGADVFCPSGKNAYPTKSVARSAASNAAKVAGRQLAIYRCPFCKRWHMSKKLNETTSSRVVSGPRRAV